MSSAEVIDRPMARNSWFSLQRCFFISVTNPKPKKEKRRRWAFARQKTRSSVSVSPPSPSREGLVSEAKDGPIATEWLTGKPQSVHQCEDEGQEVSANNIARANEGQLPHQREREFQDLAATKIQTAFRAYLARKALRALKGLVRLQAIIRGCAVRRQAITTLKCLQSIVTIQSQVCARRFQMATNFQENQDFEDKSDSDSYRRWDDSIMSKDEANALFLSKRDAAMKRERIKEYSLRHRRSTESDQNKHDGRWRYWLEQWVDAQLSKNPETVFPPNARIQEGFIGQHKPRNTHKQNHIVGLELEPEDRWRGKRFHHKKQKSVGEDNGYSTSSVVPTYMAATESAKAKARYTSSPRLRGLNLDAYSEANSPYKHYKLSSISSINSEVTSSTRICNLNGVQIKSPCLKAVPGPIKSSRSLKDLSFDSESSFPNWDNQIKEQTRRETFA